MNGLSSFLDTSGSTIMAGNVPPSRQAPSPSPSQQANGLGAGAGAGNLATVLPTAGHTADMNHLWGLVQQLSDTLAENRTQTTGIISSVQQLQARAAAQQQLEASGNTINADDVEGQVVNGESNGSANNSVNSRNASESLALRTQLHQLQIQYAGLQTQCTALQSLNADYETSFDALLHKLRPYAHQHTTAILALHSHYNRLLEAERKTNLELRLEHQAWQAGLQRAAEFARCAYREQEKNKVRGRRVRQGLREENRVMRQLLGWEERGWSDSEEDSDNEHEQEEHEGMMRGRVAEDDEGVEIGVGVEKLGFEID